MAELKKGKVVLLGAGPGDEGLLTLKGKSWLERADVVVYDHLANPALMRFAKKETERIYAGKTSGHSTLTQDEINKLLIRKAEEGKIVVRLKGGDPFIFGRGGEEAQALRAAGIPFIVVPGVPSPIGVSAYAGIPLTHRDCASNISIITGSSEKGEDDPRIEWDKIATRSGTLVFLMGARKLPHIVDNLIKHGKPATTPVAVIQSGTTPRQKTWTGTLADIVERIGKNKVKPPALTIIGEVVNLKPQTDWFETLPLFGRTVVVTRPEEQTDDILEQLNEKGAEPFLFPVIQTVAPDDWRPLDAALRNLAVYDGLIFTSVNGVKFFLQRLHDNGLDIRELKGVRLYAIGPKTEAAVRQTGIRVDGVPEQYVAESLLKLLDREPLKGKRFLLPRARVARELLPEQLRAQGAVVDVVPAYQTAPARPPTAKLAERLKNGEIDAITFTSASTVTHFLALLDPSLHPLLQKTTIACIGPVTAQTAREHQLTPAVMPEEYTVAALVEALEIYFTGKKKKSAD
jgi:uroporphyrinogen III methyltransferase/synthase